MSESILLLETPANCNECPLSLDTETHNANLCRAFEKHTVNMDSSKKPDWCPLMAIPEKKEVRNFNISSRDFEQRGYQLGWNNCINEISRGRKSVEEDSL